MSHEIRPYQSADLAELTALVHAAVHAIDDGLYSAAQREAWAPSPPDPARWTERFEAIAPVVATVGGSIAGMMAMTGDGHIDMAYVHPQQQSRGIARALHVHVEAIARAERLGRLTTFASHAAKPFFERCGYRAVRATRIERMDQVLGNWMMDKRLVAFAERGRVFVIGNSGSGKTTFASALAKRLGRAHIDLDEVAFSDQVGTRRPVAESVAMLASREGLASAVIEGCYADLVEALATEDDHLVWLALELEACVQNARYRPWEPHKWPTAAAQNAALPMLLDFIATYDERTDPTGRAAHERLFTGFVGTREKHRERPPSPAGEG